MSNAAYRSIPAAAGPMPCWWVEPVDIALGTVIVLQGAFGLTDHIRDVANHLGGAGYRAVAPDLYYRWGDRQTFSMAAINDVQALYSKLSMELFCADFERLLDTVDAGTPVATIGFCTGGLLSWVAACEYGDRLSCAASFYGTGIGGQLTRSDRLKIPLLLHFAGEDLFVPLDEVEQVRAALSKRTATFELHLYDGVSHGFMCPTDDRWDAAAAALGGERTLAFLQDWLAGVA